MNTPVMKFYYWLCALAVALALSALQRGCAPAAPTGQIVGDYLPDYPAR
jgi:cytochrome c556